MSEWLAALAVASMAWSSGTGAADVPSAAAAHEAPAVARPALMRSWAQDADEPPIEQVAEDGDDIETLDEGAPPDAGAQADDVETLDAGSPPAAQSDVETLDQGSPLPAVTDVSAPLVDTSAPPPASASSAPSGFVLPPGFGSGRVHVSTGRGGFPTGLEPCHVGAVTGRAYVGIDCGDGDSFVGHAPSFADFPFVVEADFPFGEANSPFADSDFPFGDADFPFGNDDELLTTTSEASDRDDDGVTVVSAQRTVPPVATADGSTVQQQLRARARDPLVRLQERGSRGVADSGKERKQSARGDDNGGGKKQSKSNKQQVSANQNADNGAKTESGKKKAHAKKDKKKRDAGKRGKDKKRRSSPAH